MHTIVAMGLSAARQLVTTLASVLVPDPENRAEAGLAVDDVKTITFGLDGTTYELDLSPAEASALRADLAPWVRHARSSGPSATPTPRRRTSRTTARTHPAATIRQWARSNGYTVSDRGRLPTAVVQAYQADH